MQENMARSEKNNCHPVQAQKYKSIDLYQNNLIYYGKLAVNSWTDLIEIIPVDFLSSNVDPNCCCQEKETENCFKKGGAFTALFRKFITTAKKCFMQLMNIIFAKIKETIVFLFPIQCKNHSIVLDLPFW